MIRPPHDKTTLVEYDRQLTQGVPFLNGKELVVSTSAVGTPQKFAHGLGRAYRGAWQMSSTGVSVAVVLPPESQDDANVNVTFIDAGATASTIKLWVF